MVAARGLLFNVKYIKKWCSALFTSKKSVLHTKKSSSTAVQNHHHPHHINCIFVEGKPHFVRNRKKKFALEMMKKVLSLPDCEVVVGCCSWDVYNYILIPALYSFSFFHPHTSSPLCFFVCIHITTKSFIIIANGKVDRCWCNSFVLCYFQQLRLLLTFLTIFASVPCCSFITRGENLYFLFIFFFLFRKTATGFLLCYFASRMIFLLAFLLPRERKWFLSLLVWCWWWWYFFMSKFSV